MKTLVKSILVRIYTFMQVVFVFRFSSVGRKVRLDRNVFVLPNVVSLGDEVYIGRYCYLAVPARIGNFVMLASSVALVGDDHEMNRPTVPMKLAGRPNARPIEIGDDVWIGHGCIIRSGVTIGEGAVIGAGSIVTKDIPPYSVAVGSPASVIRQRFSDEDRERHGRVLAGYRQTGHLESSET